MEATLLVGLIGAGSAVLGSAVAQLGPWIQSKTARDQAREDLMRAKFEELAQLVESSIFWVTETHTEMPSIGHMKNAPTLRACTLAALYFPELLDAATATNDAAAQTWTLAGRRDHAQEQAMAAYKSALKLLTDKIVQFAPKYARK